jgi:hypothetical protein
MNTANNGQQDVTAAETEPMVEQPKEAWVKPEITDFKPVTVARGISYRIGDGISNLC